ncbi:MAG: type VI secretion system-associated FHA domain protein TagH [Gammaproteobacteria bacterium]
MLLALSIVSEQGAALGATAFKVFDERGGCIGRVTGNDWVLPDANNFVSSRHARVSARDGVFFLEDTSSNGTFVNAPDRPVLRGGPQPLCDGDRLYIGDYEIIVQLIPTAPADVAARTPEVAAPEAPPSGLGLGTVDPLAALGGAAPEKRAVSESPAAPATPAPVAQSGAGAADILAAAGLDPSRIDPEIQQQLGPLVRLAVQGLVEVLKSRAAVKNSFRLPITSIKPVENNPLKFSTNVDDALQSLFVKRNAGYLSPVEAFQEGFDDVAFHQSAVLAGIRAGVNALLAKLHPQKLEELYERKLKRTALLGLGNKAKYWEMYRAQFEEIDRDREAHLQLLFGEDFALAYNEHLQKLAADARLRRQR